MTNYKEKDAYLYDIMLDDELVGDQGDMSFDTKDEAREDAEEYIEDELVEEYGRPSKDFKIEVYIGCVVE